MTIQHEIVETSKGLQISHFWRWLGGVKRVGCESCRVRPAVISVKFEDGYQFGICWWCKP